MYHSSDVYDCQCATVCLFLDSTESSPRGLLYTLILVSEVCVTCLILLFEMLCHVIKGACIGRGINSAFENGDPVMATPSLIRTAVCWCVPELVDKLKQDSG